MATFKTAAVLDIRGPISPQAALAKLTSAGAQFAIVTVGPHSRALVDATQMKASAEPGWRDPGNLPSIVVLDRSPSALAPGDWASVAKTCEFVGARGAIINYGSSEVALIGMKSIAALAGIAPFREGSLLSAPGFGGAPPSFICRLCNPPSFKVPEGGPPPPCPLFPDDHGEMVPL